MSGKIKHLPINKRSYQDRVLVDIDAEEVPPCGIFHVTFTNRKRQGKEGLTRFDAEGTLYSTGHVYIDTTYLQVCNFRSLLQMRAYLEEYGDCHIQWLRGVS